MNKIKELYNISEEKRDKYERLSMLNMPIENSLKEMIESKNALDDALIAAIRRAEKKLREDITKALFCD